MTGIASWDPERELNRNPNARPAEHDYAGWLRYHAGGFEEEDGVNRGWGRGRWRYSGCCQGCNAMLAADRIEEMEIELISLRLQLAQTTGRGR